MLKFKEKIIKYKIPSFLKIEDDKELINHLESETGKKIETLNSPEKTFMYKLCAVPLEGLSEKTIEVNVMYGLVNLIKNSENSEIKLYSVESSGVILDESNHRPYSMYILRAIL